MDSFANLMQMSLTPKGNENWSIPWIFLFIENTWAAFLYTLTWKNAH